MRLSKLEKIIGNIMDYIPEEAFWKKITDNGNVIGVWREEKMVEDRLLKVRTIYFSDGENMRALSKYYKD